jgi:hypothetical protein
MMAIKIIKRGNTIYEIDKYTNKPRHIIRGADKYFRKKHGDEEEHEEEYEEEEYEEPERPSPNTRRMQLLNLAGNKKKLVTKSDGLKKDIGIDESEKDKEVLERYKGIIDRKKKRSKAKPKRKICRCKK